MLVFPGSLAALATPIFHWLFNGGDKTCWPIVSYSLSLMLPLKCSFCFHKEMGRCLSESRVRDLHSLFMPLHTASPQECGRCHVIVLSIWLNDWNVLRFLLCSSPMVKYEPCIWQGAYFWTPNSLTNQSLCPPPTQRVDFFYGIVTSERSVGMCMRVFLRSSDSFILVSHPNKPQGINCLNTVTLRICLEKDQTESKASVF